MMGKVKAVYKEIEKYKGVFNVDIATMFLLRTGLFTESEVIKINSSIVRRMMMHKVTKSIWEDMFRYIVSQFILKFIKVGENNKIND